MQKGITIIELLMLLIVVGILCIVATPKYQHANANTRITEIKNLRATLEDANKRIMSMSTLPGRKIAISPMTKNTIDTPNTPNTSAQVYYDVNGNGTIDADTNSDPFTVEGKDGVDILLVPNGMVDNHQILKLLDDTSQFDVEFSRDQDHIFVGFSKGQLGVRNGNCRVFYNQTKFDMRTDGC